MVTAEFDVLIYECPTCPTLRFEPFDVSTFCDAPKGTLLITTLRDPIERIVSDVRDQSPINSTHNIQPPSERATSPNKSEGGTLTRSFGSATN